MKKIFLYAYTFTFACNAFGMLIQKNLIRIIKTRNQSHLNKDIEYFYHINDYDNNASSFSDTTLKEPTFDLHKIMQCNKGTPAFTQEMHEMSMNTSDNILLLHIIQQNKELKELVIALFKHHNLISRSKFNNYEQRDPKVYPLLQDFYKDLEKKHNIKIKIDE